MKNLSFAGALTLLFASSSPYVQAADIDFGPYCGPEAKEALTLKATPDSVTGKVGFAVASLTFPYGVALKNGTEEAAKNTFHTWNCKWATVEMTPASNQLWSTILSFRGLKS